MIKFLQMKKYQFFIVLLVVVLLSACSTPNPSFNKEDIAIIPKPLQFQLGKGSFKITKETPITQSDKKSDKAFTYLNGLLEKAAGFSLEGDSDEMDNGIIFITKKGFEKGAYRLYVNQDLIMIEATEASGFFNAIQTIRQLLPTEIEQNDVAKIDWFVPSVAIKDQPRFDWRGMHTDFSRHYFDVEEVKRFLDYLALYKMNTYHMHLTDDQGWRMEIKKYPLLTEKGAWRIPNNQDSICNERAVENDLYTIDERKFKTIDGQRKYGGFFTQEELKDIVAYADDRCITIIPEIDMPGHLKSAIDNYPFLSCDGQSGWDTVFTHPACLGKETTYEFLKNILSEVVEIFPADYVHIGGDEVNIASWKKCPLCQKSIKEHGLKDEHELQSYFNREMERFLNSKGKKLMGWDEIVEGGLTKEASVMWWRGWRPEAPKKAVENGNELVITTTDAYYFDYLNDDNTVEKIYDYEPVPESFTDEEENKVLGIQANLWSEWIPSFKRLQYQAFPRMIAVAETAWTKKEDKNSKDFLLRLNTHYERLDAMNVFYYVPKVEGLDFPIVLVDSALVKLDLAYPLAGTEIHYTLDGSVPDQNSKKYTKPFVVRDTGKIKARAYRGAVYNDLKTTDVERQSYRPISDATPKNKGLQRRFFKTTVTRVKELKIPKGIQEVTVDSIALLDEFKNKVDFSLVFEGYFHAVEDAVYEFETRSDGGDLLYVGEELIVDNGGYHGPRKRYGKIALKKGWYPISIRYLPSNKPRMIKVRYAKQGEPLKSLDAKVTGH